MLQRDILQRRDDVSRELNDKNAFLLRKRLLAEMLLMRKST